MLSTKNGVRNKLNVKLSIDRVSLEWILEIVLVEVEIAAKTKYK